MKPAVLLAIACCAHTPFAAAGEPTISFTYGQARPKLELGSQKAGATSVLGVGYRWRYLSAELSLLDGDGAVSGADPYERWRMSGVGIAAAARLPIASRADAFLKAGAYRLSGDVFVTGNTSIDRARAGLSTPDDVHWTTNAPFLGIVLEAMPLASAPPLRVRVEGTHFFANGFFRGGDFYGLGVSFVF